jgi:hypothetical protein
MCLEGFLLVLCLNITLFAAEAPKEVNRNIMEYYNFELLTLFVAVQGILAFEGLVFATLLGYLVGLHVFLAYKGMTTYEYIIRKRSKQQVIPKGSASDREQMQDHGSKCNALQFSGNYQSEEPPSRI